MKETNLELEKNEVKKACKTNVLQAFSFCLSLD
jgi:hypothetical protein